MSNVAPTHILYAVINRGRNRKSIWQPIGAAWPNHDGKGFSIRFDLLPMQGQDLVLREPLPPFEDVPASADASEDATSARPLADADMPF